MNADLGAGVSVVTSATGSAIALSPDGVQLAFAAARPSDATQRLYLRRLDQLQAAPLPETEGADSPFFSSDGQWLAFFSQGRLKKISVSGGAPVTVCDAPNGRGGS